MHNDFRDNGIIIYDNIFNEDELNLLKNQLSSLNTYEKVETDKIFDLDLFDIIFNKKIRYIINKLIPDGIIWMLFYLKTKNNNKNPHFDPQTKYGSWHRDRITDYNHNRIDFVDIMIYLNNVGENDGGFAFLPIRPDFENEIDKAKKSSKIIGKAGTCIVSRIDWFHSATPNQGQIDREILRISLAKNMYDCRKQEEEEFKKIRKFYNESDPFLHFLFGGDRRWYKFVEQPSIDIEEKIKHKKPDLNYNFSSNYKNIVKSFIKKLIK